MISCRPQEISYLDQPASDAYDALLKEEMQNIPDFSAPPVQVENFKAEGTPSHLKWYTSYPKDLSSKALKKGGIYYGFLGDIPNTFRYMGPGADELCVKLFNTQMPFLWTSFETFEFMPCSAVCWSVDLPSKTVYYKLNETMLWSDGVPCTADDWLFANEFCKSKKIVDPVKNRKHNNLEVKKINDFCLSVKSLDNQVYTEEELLDITNFKPIASHFYNGTVPDDWIAKYNRIAEPTTGPYILSDFDYNNGLHFTKIENWWASSYPHFKAVANFDEIFYRIITGDKRPAFTKFARGLFDIIHIDDQGEWAKAEASADVQNGFINLWRGCHVPVQGPTGLFFNTQAPPLDSEFVRKGLYYAIDIEGMIDGVYADKQVRLHTIGTGQAWGNAEFNNFDIKKPPFDPIKARALFAKAGYDKINPSGILVNSAGNELSFVILYDDPLLYEAFGFLYAKALTAGVRLEFRLMGGKLLDNVSNRDYQAWWGTLNSYRIPDNYSLFHSSFAESKIFNNFFGYSNPEMDALLEKYEKNSLTYAEKAAVNREIEKIAHEAALMIPSFYKNTIDVMAWKWICFPAWLNMKHQKYLDDPMFGYMWFDAEIENECIRAKNEGKILQMRVYSLSERY
ncbi:MULTISPECIES: ABC transporter substrate-binding protein [unclassified Treponema]|uniref:ABC transporter substrate-binding protein n=1 Tax=unclassified Treponema TaxID=2638727 RepID=UPI0020A33DFF|nr:MULTISPECIES: ABC transporter substrate-binding protein [unclassified Treponema]